VPTIGREPLLRRFSITRKIIWAVGHRIFRVSWIPAYRSGKIDTYY
jgi:hypothetical protein